MHPFLKQLFRSPIRLTAFLLLLILSGAMLGVGINVFWCAREQAAQMEEAYTTVAVPDYRTQLMMDSETHSLGETNSKIDPLAFFYEMRARKELIVQAKAAGEASPYVRLTDNRRIAAAYSPGSLPVTSGSSDPLAYEEEFDAPYHLAIFTVLCTDVRQTEQVGQSITAAADGGESRTLEYMYQTYEASALVEECVLLSDAYAPPDTLMVTGDILDADGNIPLEAGKRYLIWGVYCAPQIMQVGFNEWEEDVSDAPTLTLGHQMLYPGGFEEDIQLINGKYHARKRVLDAYPVCAELAEGTSAEDFLSSVAGETWENVRELCDVTRQSVPVIATQKLESMLAFNTLQTPIVQGRSFTEAEYESAAKVCVLGSEYAVKNGIHIGDMLPLSFYDTHISSTQRPWDGGYVSLTVVEPYLPGTQRSGAENYIVVGIYQSTGFRHGNFNFSPNTVFLPGGEAALPGILNADSSSGGDSAASELPVLYSIVLKNGSVERFEQEMAEQGFADCFLYYDQGYAQAQGSIETLERNAVRLLAFSAALGAASALLYALLYALWARRTAVSMRLMGIKGASAFGQAMEGALLTALTTLPFGMLAGYLLFFKAAAVVIGEGSDIRYRFEYALLAAAAQLVAGGAASLGFLAGILAKNPLKLLKKVR